MELENFFKEMIDGTTHTLLAPPHNYTTPDGRSLINFHLNPTWMGQYGWREWTDEELEAWHAQYDSPVPVPVWRFSKLKIMEFAGGKWAAIKEKLVTEGLWEYWENATFLSTDHPVFQEYFSRLSPEEQADLIARCQWEEVLTDR